MNYCIVRINIQKQSKCVRAHSFQIKYNKPNDIEELVIKKFKKQFPMDVVEFAKLNENKGVIVKVEIIVDTFSKKETFYSPNENVSQLIDRLIHEIESAGM